MIIYFFLAIASHEVYFSDHFSVVAHNNIIHCRIQSFQSFLWLFLLINYQQSLLITDHLQYRQLAIHNYIAFLVMLTHSSNIQKISILLLYNFVGIRPRQDTYLSIWTYCTFVYIRFVHIIIIAIYFILTIETHTFNDHTPKTMGWLSRVMTKSEKTEFKKKRLT